MDAFLEDAEEIYGLLYLTSLNLEDVEQADRWCDEGHRRFATSTLLTACALYTLASMPTTASDIPVAWEKLDEYVSVGRGAASWNRPAGMTLVAAVIARAGLPDSARAVLASARQELNASDPNAPAFDYYEAYVLVLLGGFDEALDRLERYVGTYPSQREFLPADWWFRDLWTHLRFLRLMAQPG